MNRPSPRLPDCLGILRPQDEVPGWQEIARREVEARGDAMLGLPEDICGLKVKPLTFEHLQWLDIYQSPFLSAAPVEVLLTLPDIHLHVARFMWVLSPEWKPFNKLAQKIYFWRYRRTLYEKKSVVPTFRKWLRCPLPVAAKSNTETIVTAIHQFMDDSTWDLRADGDRVARKSYYSQCAAVVRALCKATNGAVSPFPAAPNAAIRLPIRIVSQLLRATARSYDSKTPMSNRCDELERDWIAELNAQLKKN